MNAPPQVLGGGLGFRVDELITSAGGAYRVRGFLGRGGMAQVLDVEDETLGKRFALKILDAHLSSDPASVERFEREARALAKLDHPHLVAVVRLERTTSAVPRPFFLMERLRGGTLRDHLNRGAISPERGMTLCGDLLRALDYVHERKLLHRDVKPSNLFVHVDAFGEERAKLLDFGVMKLLLETDDARGFFGTAHYAAPEQLETGAVLGPASDVYGAGIVLFETLTGIHPFVNAERTPRGAREARRAGAPSLALHLNRTSIPREVTDELTSLVAALLARDPLTRPSAGTAARALARINRIFASSREEQDHVLSARTAVPLPFLPGHLAAPTEIDDPGIARFAGFHANANANANMGRTIPMAPPDGFESVAERELSPMPRRHDPRRASLPVCGASYVAAAPIPLVVPPPPQAFTRRVPPPLPSAAPHGASPLPGAGPNGTERLSPEENPVRALALPRPAESDKAASSGSAFAPRVSPTNKLLFALAVLVLATVLGVLGKRPRMGSAKASPTAHGVAAGTSSPASHLSLHLL